MKTRCSPLCRCQYPWCGCPHFNHRPNQCHFPYIEALAGKGFAQAISEDEGLRQGVTTYQGYLTSLPVAQGLNRDYTDINDLV